MDFVEGFSCFGGKSVVLTVVDRFSKYAVASSTTSSNCMVFYAPVMVGRMYSRHRRARDVCRDAERAVIAHGVTLGAIACRG
jgi:hypothetical protein